MASVAFWRVALCAADGAVSGLASSNSSELDEFRRRDSEVWFKLVFLAEVSELMFLVGS
jgi:hypothetical protein